MYATWALYQSIHTRPPASTAIYSILFGYYDRHYYNKTEEVRDFAQELILEIKRHRFPLDDEKRLQRLLYEVLRIAFPKNQVIREYRLDKENHIDLYVFNVGIEVKIKKGESKRKILKQCTRYCEFDDIQSLILITGATMGFPEQIHGKNCYIVKLSEAWL